MNSEETYQLFEKLINAYPNDKFFARPKEKVDATIELWQEALADVTLDCANRFLTEHIRKSQYMPAICDFYQFHRQELIDKRMRIETQQIEYSGDHVNMLAVIAKQMQERREAEAKAKADDEAEKEAEKRKKYLNDPNQLYVTTFTDGFEEKYKRAEIEIMLKNGDQNEHGKVAKLKVYEDGE
jgi:hypothetical protein